MHANHKKEPLKISVIIPLYNDKENIILVLDSLARQITTLHEIIIIDNNSTDNSYETVKDFISHHPHQNIILEREMKKGPGQARNTGIKKAKGNIIAFIDSDCIPDKDWIRSICVFFENHQDFDAVGGTYRPFGCQTVAENFLNLFWGIDPSLFPETELKTQEDIYQGKYLSTFNSAFRKSAIDEIGEFDPVFSFAGEDMDFLIRSVQKGHRIVVFHKAMVIAHHFSGHSAISILRKQDAYAKGWCLILKKHFQKTFHFYMTSRFHFSSHFPFTAFITQYSLYIVFLLALFFSKYGLWIFCIVHGTEMLIASHRIKKRLALKNCTVSFPAASGVYILWAGRRLYSIPVRLYFSLKSRMFYL